jgi:hypothetical protein
MSLLTRRIYLIENVLEQYLSTGGILPSYECLHCDFHKTPEYVIKFELFTANNSINPGHIICTLAMIILDYGCLVVEQNILHFNLKISNFRWHVIYQTFYSHPSFQYTHFSINILLKQLGSVC